MHRIALLGSTGSIGTSTLDVVRRLGEPFEIVSVAAGNNWEAVSRQIDEFRPRRAAMFQPEAAVALRQSLNGHPTEVLHGMEGICALACDPEVDIVIMGISGAAALPAAVEAVKAGKRVGLANKEVLVMAGEILNPLAHESGAEIIPVDSEHSALFQSLESGHHGEVSKLLLTASGGPFRETPIEEFGSITPEQALKHPTWDMGRKITIDSATMMNKSLEIIEARWLFDMPADKIDVVVHPQSIVHSMVEYCDGSVIGPLGLPDMRVPIQLAITYPRRMKSPVAPPDWSKIGELNFSKPDMEKFPSLKMGFRAAREGGTLGAVMNAANEIAVEMFFQRQINFLQIFALVESVMDTHEVNAKPSLEDVFAADTWAREQANKWVSKI
ncbi:MAG: 1-deoxy-D-xylulose-5-phosphate reductoisomerase [Planctomycetota bacterium]|nr:1-deoxy-D-xylulose-5-phosphate reductoisomerase [Planctomycetota bacterium]